MRGSESLADIFAEAEAEAIAAAEIERKAEDAAWRALSPEQQEAIIEARAAKFASLDDLPEDDDELDEDEEGDEDA